MMRANREKLEDQIAETEKAILEKYFDSVSEYIAVITEQSFYDGFCMGDKIISEALNGVEQIL